MNKNVLRAKRLLLFSPLLFLIFSLLSFSTRPAGRGYHGPFLIYTDTAVVVAAAGADGETRIEQMKKRPDSLEVISGDGQHRFRVGLHPHYPTPLYLSPSPETLVLADLHGNLEAFVAALRGNGVIDENYSWTYGTNRLVVDGDILDRGRNSVVIFWLVYKLEQEAREAGGDVVFLIGNHEEMVLRGDLRYLHRADSIFAVQTGIPHDGLYGPRSEIGRWIRSKPFVAVNGNILYVHAGLSAGMADGHFSLEEINLLARDFLGVSSRTRRAMDPRATAVYGTDGPIWYRGLVRDDEQHPGISDSDLERVLEYYGVERIVVGHTEVPEVHSRYNGRVIPVNVKHYENYGRNGSAGLLISGEELYAVDYNGNRTPLF